MIRPQAFLAEDKGVYFHNSQCRFFQSSEIEIFVLVFHHFIRAERQSPRTRMKYHPHFVPLIEGGKGGIVIPFHAQILTKFTRHVLNKSLSEKPQGNEIFTTKHK